MYEQDNIIKNRRLMVKAAWSTPIISIMHLPLHAQTSEDTEPPTDTTPPTICTIPDLTVSISASSSNLIGPNEPIDFTITIREINGCATNGDDIAITFLANPRLTITNTTFTGLNFNSSPLPFFQLYTASGQVLPANGSATIMISAVFSPQTGTSGSFPYRATIPVMAGGGETNTLNNVAEVNVAFNNI